MRVLVVHGEVELLLVLLAVVNDIVRWGSLPLRDLLLSVEIEDAAVGANELKEKPLARLDKMWKHRNRLNKRLVTH